MEEKLFPKIPFQFLQIFLTFVNPFSQYERSDRSKKWPRTYDFFLPLDWCVILFILGEAESLQKYPGEFVIFADLSSSVVRNEVIHEINHNLCQSYHSLFGCSLQKSSEGSFQ